MRLKYIFLFIFVFLLVLSGCSSNKPGEYDDFAFCLTEKGVKMYGTEWCSHCRNQKEEFGKSFQYVDYIDCDKNKADCQKAGIRGYPTWDINGQNYPGGQSLEKLSALSGCELN